MLTSFSEFKFFQSFRIPVEQSDNLRFLVEIDNAVDGNQYIEDACLVDISITGLGLKTKERISVGTPVTISLQFKKHHLDLSGKIVRAFTDSISDQDIIYGVELEEEPGINKFLEQYILSFSAERLKDCLIHSALKERYTNPNEGFEMFSLLLSLFKDITHFGDKEGFVESMLEEVVRILNAQRSSIFLINPDTNELEAIGALGIPKDELKFDYRLGVAGSVFTTGVALNIDVVSDKTRFNEKFDKQFGFETKSIICHPIHNREDKIIGVIEVINKRNQDRFTVEDEKTMKVLALVFSSVFHNYNPISEHSQIRRFSKPFDRENAIIGKTAHVNSLRSTIIKVKDIDAPVLIQGEKGVGKTLFAKILHEEGQRGLKSFEYIDCTNKNEEELEGQIFGNATTQSKFEICQGGTLLLREVGQLSMEFQKRLAKVLTDRRIPGSLVTIDLRIMASSCDDLTGRVEDGTFYHELYGHLSKAFISIEPLRKRLEDIPELLDYFLKIECKKQGLLLKSFSSRATDKMLEYDWPGNIQELKNCVERAVLYNPKNHVISDIELENSATPLLDVSFRKRMFGDMPYVHDYNILLKDRVALIERQMIINEIKRHNGNKSKAAKSMGISREALRKKMLLSNDVLTHLNGDQVHVEDQWNEADEAGQEADVLPLKKKAA